MELASVPAGAFTMGSTSGDATERPLTYVTLSEPFWLGKYEVTQAQWEALMHNNPAQFRGDRRPVEKVSWLEAMDFCRRLTERERTAGRLPVGYRYVLPTEAQWEYACRAGGAGDTADADPVQTWHQGNSGNTTQPVGGKAPNDWGFYDMHGNVWEWCLDWKTSYPGGEVTDPRGPSSGQFRIFRGGAWNSALAKTRAATRVGAPPDAKGFEVGFRVALSCEP
jgi:formylglycine-generating enzyme required for sulfatase activity